MNVRLTVVLAVVMLVSGAVSGTALAQEPEPVPPLDTPPLFSEGSGDPQADLAPELDRTVRRRRLTNVNLDLVRGGQGREPAGALALNLFADTSLVAVRDRMESVSPGSLSWVGHVQGIEVSQVVLVVKDGVMAGEIFLPNASFAVRPAGNGLHTISEIDQSAYPIEANPIEVRLPPPAAADAGATATDDGSIVDVMVVYTPAARVAAGGRAGIESEIDLAVSTSNASYANSGIIQRLRLVHTGEVAYTEAGNIETDLTLLTGPADGAMDEVHTLRNSYAADLVALVTATDPDGFCGIAHVMAVVSPAFEAFAFSVTVRRCATSNLSFPHELGHNMSARHDWYQDSTDNSPFHYNHGYVNTIHRWRTVQGYANQCWDLGFYCARIPFWSNPSGRYNGAPTGTAAEPRPTNNSLALNTTRTTVANFRQGGVNCVDAAAEPNDSARQARAIGIGQTMSYAFCTWGDVDWVRFQATAGTFYHLRTGDLAPGTDTVLELYQDNGTPLLASDDNGGGGRASLIYFAPPSSGSYRLKIRHRDGTAGDPAYTYKLRLAASPNLLRNPGFEVDANGDGKPDLWSNHWRFTRSHTLRRSGGFAGKHAPSDSGNYAILQKIPAITGGATYTFRGWVNIPPTADTFQFKIQIRWLDSGGAVLATKTIKSYTSGTDGWNQVTGTAIAPPTATQAVLRMLVGNLNAVIYVDQFDFRR